LAESTAGLLSGVDLVDLGPRRLRDLPTPVGVFQVRAPGLQTEFPALRALDVSPGNLRPQTTSFIGRESEVAELQAAVKAHRLVTLTGVGGVGKTRLAVEVAARLVDEYPDGVWFFELAAVTDPAAVPDAVAAVLGIIQQPGKTVSESVAAALEGRVRLLVIDNCERVSELPELVYFEIEERHFFGNTAHVVNSMTVFEFDTDNKICHVDVYLQQPAA
jgi:AAA ATPase domain